MNGLDIALAIILAIGLIGGFQKGFIKSISGFIGIGIAIWIGFNFSNLLESFIDQQEFVPDTMVKIVSLILTIVLVVIAIKILSKILHEVVHTVGLGIFNRLGGAVFGLLINVISLSALIYYTTPILTKLVDEKLWNESQIIPYLTMIVDFMKINLFSN